MDLHAQQIQGFFDIPVDNLFGLPILAEYYKQHPFHILTMEEYIDHLIGCLSWLRKDIVVERITGDGPKDLLITPKWIGHKRLVLNTIHKEMKQRNFMQGGSLCQKNL